MIRSLWLLTLRGGFAVLSHTTLESNSSVLILAPR